jgi:hypothetical protein
VVTALGSAACSLLLPWSGFDDQFGAADTGTSDAPSDASQADASEAAADAGADAASCVMPAPAQCDADIATDNANCGACGHKCGTTTCKVGTCDPENAFWFPFVNPTGVALDDNYFYGVGATALFGAEGGAARGSKTGSGASVLAIYSPDPRRIAIATNGADIYWTQAGGIATSPNNTLPDGGPNVAKVIVAGQSNPLAIAVDDAYVYWTNPPPDGDVWRAALPNGNDAKAIVTHGDGKNAYGLAIDGQFLYFTSYTQGGAVWRADKKAENAGQVATRLADGQSFPSDIFVNAEAVYWTNGSLSNGAVMKLPKGASAPLSLAGPRVQPGGVFAREPYVYWYETGTSNRDIWRADKCSGSPLRVAIGQKVTDLAVEDKYVYWATGEAINRVPR